jgi:hypothetical protein
LSIRIRSNNFMKDRRMKSFIKVVGLDNIAWVLSNFTEYSEWSLHVFYLIVVFFSLHCLFLQFEKIGLILNFEFFLFLLKALIHILQLWPIFIIRLRIVACFLHFFNLFEGIEQLFLLFEQFMIQLFDTILILLYLWAKFAHFHWFLLHNFTKIVPFIVLPQSLLFEA